MSIETGNLNVVNNRTRLLLNFNFHPHLSMFRICVCLIAKAFEDIKLHINSIKVKVRLFSATSYI